LLWAKNDIMISRDQQKAVVLVLLDLSAAFDTVDRNVLFSTLTLIFGLSWYALD
jgi:hypothetical protein